MDLRASEKYINDLRKNFLTQSSDKTGVLCRRRKLTTGNVPVSRRRRRRKHQRYLALPVRRRRQYATQCICRISRYSHTQQVDSNNKQLEH